MSAVSFNKKMLKYVYLLEADIVVVVVVFGRYVMFPSCEGANIRE